MQLRDYQRTAIDALYAWLGSNEGNPCLVAPTGSGKSLLIAQICKDVVADGGRVCVLAHVKELLTQNADKIRRLCPDINIGIYSAGLKQRDTKSKIIVAGIASAYKRACEFDAFDLILIDEAHRLSPDDSTMYRRFISDARVVNPHLRIVGLTATPYRLDCGPLCGPDMVFTHIAHEIPIAGLIAAGYLSPISSKASANEIDTDKLGIKGGEYDVNDVDEMVNTDEAIADNVAEIVSKTHDRRSVLIFANSVSHAENIVKEFDDSHGFECGIVIGETNSIDRAATLERFNKQELKYLVNVGVLTTGYDCPSIDCVVLLRATLSTSLYVQMVGRGLRICEGKKHCLILDFGQNIRRHGPIDDIKLKPNGEPDTNGEAPVKVCEQCGELCHAAVRDCPDCGFEFPPPAKVVTVTAAKAALLASQRKVIETWLDVKDIAYHLHRKKGADESAPRTLRVDYRVGMVGMTRSEWVCFEHDGFARQKAERWWFQRSKEPCPRTIERALEIIEGGGIAVTLKIKVRESEDPKKFPEIIAAEVGEVPEPPEDLAGALALANVRRDQPLESSPEYVTDEADIPF